MDPGRRVLQDAGIIWEDDRIVLIGSSAEIKAAAARKKIAAQNCSGKIAFPGFINTHTHLYQNLLKGIGTDTVLEKWWHKVIAPAGINLRETHLEAAVVGAAIEAVRGGVTTLVDYMQVHPVKYLADVEIEALRKIGVRLVYGRGFRNTGLDSGFPIELIEKTTDVFDDVLRLKQKYETPDRMTQVWLAPAGAWALSEAGLKETGTFAGSYGIPVTMHMYETATDELICRQKYKKAALAYFAESGLLSSELLAVHCVKMGQREIEVFKSYGVKISHNPVSNMYLASGVAPVPLMLQAGLTVGIGTDGAASNNCNDMMEAIKSTALLHKVHSNDPTAITAHKVLEMATVEAAKIVGLEQEIGSLEVGKKADLIVLNPYRCARMCPVHDPVASLVYSAGNRSIEKVVVNGKTILENGSFSDLDEEKALRVEQEAAEALFNKAGYNNVL